ncbi:MAG: hypothetical protein JWO38_8218 [Gemmataceae bacterium]|nr:hypothetical protein [Gemmataceae bacterium]
MASTSHSDHSLRECGEEEVIPFDPTPPDFQILGMSQAMAARATELWRATVRVELAFGLVKSLPDWAATRLTVSPSTQARLTRCVPEFKGLKEVLDHVALWPTVTQPDIVPPPRKHFPHNELRELLAAIPSVIERDVQVLETEGAIRALRTSRERPFWGEISFAPPPSERGARSRWPAPGAEALCSRQTWHPATIDIRHTYSRRHVTVVGEVRAFRNRLQTSPLSALRVLIGGGPPDGGIPSADLAPAPADPRSEARPVSPEHSPDFATVRWRGQDYHFTKNQAPIIRALYQAWEKGASGLSSDYLLKLSDTNSSEIRDVFRGRGKMHPAWGKMFFEIQGRRGIYRLNDDDHPTERTGPAGTS